MTGFSMDATALKLRAIAPSFAAASDALLEVRFRKTFEAAAIGIGICDLEGRIVEANSAMAQLLRYHPEELVGMNPWRAPWNSSDGESDHMELAEGAAPEARGIEELLREGSASFVLEKQCQPREGPKFWGRLTASVARDERCGQAAFLVVLLEDISERRRMEEHLRQSEKMAAIGQLASGVAHDFNNLLTGTLLYCDLLVPELESGETLHHYAEEIRRATEQGAALTQQLLALARKEGQQAHAIDVNEIVHGVENLLRRLIGEQIELITACDAAPGTALADAAQLQQILLNLVLNGRDALGRGKVLGGKIRVSTRLEKWPSDPEKGHGPLHSAGNDSARADVRAHRAANACWGPRLGPGPYGREARGVPTRHPDGVNDERSFAVLLTVEDNGCGMNAETCAHLFEPFFTTKAAGTGTGLGLGTVQRIARELGGAVEIASAPGFGTRVDVFLPMPADGETETARQGHVSGNSAGRDFDTRVLNSKVERNKGGSPC
jgi:PAS domain S-box-containing protein